MDNTTSISQPNYEEKLTSFFKKWAWLFAIASTLVAFLFLLGPICQWRLKADDGTKTYYIVHLWDLLNGTYSLDWSIITVLCLFGLCLVLPLFHKKTQEFMVGNSVASSVLCVLLLFFREFFSFANSSIDADHLYMQWGLVMAAIFAFVAAIFSLVASYEKETITVRDMTEIAIFSAAAIALNFVVFFRFSASGGSINIAMLPLYIIALRHGPAKGFLAGGLIFGLITCFTDGYGLYTYPFDYLFAFGAVGILGFFRKFIFVPGQKNYSLKGEIALFIGIMLASTVRCLSSTISGIIFYASELSGANKFLASFILAAPYSYGSGLAVAAILMGFYGPLCRVNTMFPVQSPLSISNQERKNS